MVAEGTESIPAAWVDVGDVITLPGASVYRCLVQMVRSVVPGVVWLYLVDTKTGERLRGHVALPLNQTVLRHRAEASGASERATADS